MRPILDLGRARNANVWAGDGVDVQDAAAVGMNRVVGTAVVQEAVVQNTEFGRNGTPPGRLL